MSTFTLSIFNLFGGFVMAKNVIPDWLIWVYWFVPDSWTLRGLCVNQYRAAKFDVCVYDGVDYCSEYNMKMGEYLLKQYAVPSGHSWVCIDIIYLCCIYAFFMGLGAFVLEYKRYDGPTTISLKPKHEANDNETDSTDSYVLATTPKHSGTMSGSGSPMGEVVLDVPRREKVFTPVTIAFQDLHYFVPKPGNPKESLELLKG
ncbi:hypothetical protein F441_17806, partial [Phytophthora nicotianae CJ01A1]